MTTAVLVTWCVASLLAAPAQEISTAPQRATAKERAETLAAGAARDEHGRTGLMRAALEGDRALFRRILEFDRLRFEAATKRAAEPLSESGMSLVNAIKARRRLVEAADEDGVTPLMLASGRGWDDLVQRLLRAGAKPSVRDANGLDASSHAERSGFASLARSLRDAAH